MSHAVHELADRFASAAIDGSEWLDSLKALASATGSSHGQLIGIGGDSTVPFNWVTDFSEEAVAEFVAIDGGNPLINPRVAVSVGASVLDIRDENDYHAVAPHMISDVYADFCRDYDIPYGCQSKLVEDQGGLVGLAILRGEKDGETTQEQRALFAAVAPHVRGAVRMQLALEHEGLRLASGALEAVSAAVFICATDGLVRALTPAAEALLSAGPLRTVDRRLAAQTARDTDLLRDAIGAHALHSAPLSTLILGARANQLPVVLDICAAPRRPWNLSFSPNVLVIARTARRWHGSAAAILNALYGLSPAEADVALRLARGEPRETIADARGARIETIRAQLKSAFAKLGVSREVELAALFGELLRV